MAANDFLQQVLRVYSAAREARTPHEAIWDRCLRAYRGEYDFSGRQPWQSHCVLPKIPKDVDFVARRVAAAIGDDQQALFTLTGEGAWGKLAAPILEAVVQANLDRQRFTDVMQGLLTYGQLTPGICAKVTETAGPWPGYVSIQPVPYRRVFRDPTGRNQCLLCVTPFDKADVLQLCRKNGWDGSRLAAFDAVGDADARANETAWLRGCARAVGWEPSGDELTRTVFLLEYWGPVYNGTERTSEWAYGVVANKSVVLHGPEDLPYGDDNGLPRKLTDVIVGDLLCDPFAIYAKPYVLDALPVAEAEQEVINLIIDQAKLQVNAIGVNYDAIEAAGADGARALIRISHEGVAAAATVPFRGASPALAPLNLANFSPELLNVHSLLDQERQSATGVTDIIRGTSAREDTASQTLGEYQSKSVTGNDSLSGLGKGLEKRFIEPLVELILWHYRSAGFSLIAQIPETDEEYDPETERDKAAQALQSAIARAEATHRTLHAICGDKIEAAIAEALDKGMAETPDEALLRLDEACRDEYEVHSSGVTAVMDRELAQAKLDKALTQIGALGAAPVLDRSRVIRTLFRLADLDINDALRDNFEQILDQQDALAEQAQQAAALPPSPMAGAGASPWAMQG